MEGHMREHVFRVLRPGETLTNHVKQGIQRRMVYSGHFFRILEIRIFLLKCCCYI